MSKVNRDVPELTDEELAFEMIEITCDEMNSLAKAFDMLSALCIELNSEGPKEQVEDSDPSDTAIH
jgi:hypothetical protein